METLCCLCGHTGDITDDHIPPKNLFRDIPNDELITVPSCKRCNGDSKKDDEYFRNFLIPHQQAARHPKAIELNQHVRKGFDLRILQTGKRKPFEYELRSEIHQFDAYTSSGIYLGKKDCQFPDFPRLQGIFEKYFRCLYFHSFETRFPSDLLDIAVVDWRQIDSLAVQIEIDINRYTDELLQVKTIAVRDIFAYRCLQFLDEIPNIVVCEMLFFQTERFFLIAYPKLFNKPIKWERIDPNMVESIIVDEHEKTVGLNYRRYDLEPR